MLTHEEQQQERVPLAQEQDPTVHSVIPKPLSAAAAVQTPSSSFYTKLQNTSSEVKQLVKCLGKVQERYSKFSQSWVVVVDTFNPSAGEAEADGSL